MGSANTTPKRITETNLIQTCEGHEAGINCLALNNDPFQLATGSDDCTVRVWGFEDGDTNKFGCHKILYGHDTYITAVTFHKNHLVTAAADGTVRKWDLQSGECILALHEHDDLIRKLICVNSYIITASSDKTAVCSCFETGKLIMRFKGHSRLVTTVAFAGNSTIGKPDSPTDDMVTIQLPNTPALLGMPERIYTGSADRTAKAWSIKSGKCLMTFEGHTQPITEIQVSDNKEIIYTASIDNTIRSWFTHSGDMQFIFLGHTGSIVCMKLCDKILYTGSIDLTARSWLTETGKLVRTYGKHRRTVTSICLHEGMIVTGCGDGKIRFFDEKTGTLQKVLMHPNRECCTAVEMYKDKLFSAANDGALYIWNYAIQDDDLKPNEDIELPAVESPIQPESPNPIDVVVH